MPDIKNVKVPCSIARRRPDEIRVLLLVAVASDDSQRRDSVDRSEQGDEETGDNFEEDFRGGRKDRSGGRGGRTI